MRWLTRQIVDFTFIFCMVGIFLAISPLMALSWLFESFCRLVDWAYEGHSAPWDGV